MFVSFACPFGGLPRAASSGVAVCVDRHWSAFTRTESGEADMSSVETMEVVEEGKLKGIICES